MKRLKRTMLPKRNKTKTKKHDTSQTPIHHTQIFTGRQIHVFNSDSILKGLCFRLPPVFPTSLDPIAAPEVRSKETALWSPKSNLAEAAAVTAKELLNNDVELGCIILPGEGLKFLALWTSEAELSELCDELRLSALSRLLMEKSSGPDSSSESPPTTSIMHSSLSFSGSESERMPAFRCWARYSWRRASKSTAIPFALSFRACLSNALASFFLLRALLDKISCLS